MRNILINILEALWPGNQFIDQIKALARISTEFAFILSPATLELLPNAGYNNTPNRPNPYPNDSVLPTELFANGL